MTTFVTTADRKTDRARLQTEQFRRLRALEASDADDDQQRAQDLRELLILDNMPMTRYVVKKYLRIYPFMDSRPLTLTDLIGAAYEALIVAVDSYDPDRGARFITLAIEIIKCRVHREAAFAAGPIRIPERAYIILWRSARRATAAPDWKPPGLLGYTQACASAIVAPEPASAEPIDENAIDPAEAAERSEESATLRRLLKQIDDRAAQIVQYRHGIDGPGHSLAETAKKFGLSRERIRQIDIKALNYIDKIVKEGQYQCFRTLPSISGSCGPDSRPRASRWTPNRSGWA